MTGPADAARPGGSVLPACVVSPELTEGPYFVDEQLNRSDIRSNPADGVMREGTPLELALIIWQIRGGQCTPLQGAAVDVWHCDALGVYSDVVDPGFNTVGQQFLRGCQMTNEEGVVRFTTIYPGWYEGRSVHIHFKIRMRDADERDFEYTSQLFFDEDLTDQVHAAEPYARKGMRTLHNEGDSIYQMGGELLTLDVVPAGDGYSATLDIGLQFD